MKRKLWMVLLAGVTGCDSIVASEVEQELWNALEIRNYQFTHTVSCFCGFVGPNPALITVQNGVVTRVEYLPGSGGQGSYPTQGYPTIDSLFAIIDRVQARDPADLDVDFDDTYHFPRTIAVDYAKNAVDDEVTYAASGFKLLASPQ